MAQILRELQLPPIARSHMCFQKPPMMWLFEAHVASQLSTLNSQLSSKDAIYIVLFFPFIESSYSSF